MRDALSPSGAEKSVPSTQKKNPPFVQPQNKARLGFEPTTYGYNFRPMVNFHWRAGRLSRGIGHVLVRVILVTVEVTALYRANTAAATNWGGEIME